MGSTQSTSAAATSRPASKSPPSVGQEQALPRHSVPEQNPRSADAITSTAKPMPFAVMRNCHETIRAAYKDMDEALLTNRSVVEFDAVFKETVRGMATHALLEEHGLFDMLDKEFNNCVRKAGLRGMHKKEEELQLAVLRAVEKYKYYYVGEVQYLNPPDEDAPTVFSNLVKAYKAWKQYNLKHLKEEEKVMMPRIQQLSKSVYGSSQTMGELLHNYVLDANFGDGKEFAWFVAWNARVLAKRGSTTEDPFTAMRVFVWGCQASLTPEQWLQHVLPALKQELSTTYPEMYQRLKKEYNIEGPGKIIAMSADA